MFAPEQILACPEERGAACSAWESRNFVGIMTPSRGPLQVAVRQRSDAQKEGSGRRVASGFED